MSDLGELERHIDERDRATKLAWPLVAQMLEPSACQDGIPPAFDMDAIVALSQAISLKRIADALERVEPTGDER